MLFYVKRFQHKMAEQNSDTLEANVLKKTDQLLEDIYENYTRISLYEKTIGKRVQSLRLPTPDPDYWKLCKKSYEKLLDQTKGLNLDKSNGDLEFDLEAIQYFILLNDIDKTSNDTWYRARRKSNLSKRRFPKL